MTTLLGMQAVAVTEDGAAVRSDVIDVNMDAGDMKDNIELRQAASQALSLMTEPLTDEQLAPLSIEMSDFEEALGMCSTTLGVGSAC